MELVSLAPVVGHRVREYLTVLVERALRDRLLARLRGLELGARVLVPEGEATVGADSGEGAVHRVERNIVHRENILEQDGVRSIVVKYSRHNV